MRACQLKLLRKSRIRRIWLMADSYADSNRCARHFPFLSAIGVSLFALLLDYEPKANLRKTRQTKKGHGDQYGLGKPGEERCCVKCVEQMLEEHRRKLQRENPHTIFLTGHPIFEIAY